jgi:diguanylate cyclase (GGDEF)-like protein/hemerythrin-like metal-binding protein
MAGFLASQLDYVYFAYGLALVLLGAVAASIPRERSAAFPWAWLAAFAITHGLVEWLELGAIALGDLPAFRLVRDLALLGSYLLLLEFARRAHAAVRGSGPGPWLTIAAGAIPLAAGLAVGPELLSPVVRVTLALPAALWSATALAAEARRADASAPVRGASLSWAATCLAFYGIAAGLVLPPAPLVPRAWVSPATFLAATGIPVQLVRGMLCGGAALAVWAHAVSLEDPGRVTRKRWRHFWSAGLAILALLGAGWVLTSELGRLHDRRLLGDAEVAAIQVQDHLAMEMDEAAATARTAALLVSRLDLWPADGDRTRVEAVLEALVPARGEEAVALLDRDGRVVASTARGARHGPPLADVSEEPWFRAAREGHPGRQAGADAAGRPIFLAGEPVRDAAGAVTGVVVARHLLGPQSFGPVGIGDSFLVTPGGRVLVTGAASYRDRDLWATDAKGTKGGRPPVVDRPVEAVGWVVVDGERHVALRKPLPGTDLSTVTWKRSTALGTSRFLGILVTLLVAVAVVVAFAVLQRQLDAEADQSRRRKEAEGRARDATRRADTDALTGVANRQAFDEAIGREVARARRFRQPLAVVLLDLDHFKQVNDRHGHAGGDQVLVGAAHLFAERVRESDLVARWGGEEFAVVTPMTDAAGAVRLAEKLRGLLEVEPHGRVGPVTASFGVAELRADDTVQTMLRRADAALYEAKAAGRNLVRCAEPWVDVEALSSAAVAEPARGSPGGASACMETGHTTIDAEHRELAAAIDAFATDVLAGDAAVAPSTLAALAQGVADHFADEEALMRLHGYAGRQRHEEAHRSFLADLARLEGELARAGLTPAFRRWATTRLPDWFRFHVLAHDVALGKFLAGVPAEAPATRRAREGVRA